MSSALKPPPAEPAPTSAGSVKVPAPRRPTGVSRALRWVVAAMLLISGLATLAYSGVSVYAATQIVRIAPTPITTTPASYGLGYREVTFTSREDDVTLRGWFIPGVRTDGTLTAERVIIVVPGAKQNRADLDAGALPLSVALAHNGFAVLAYDPRGTGESQAVPFSMGYFEQRDVLGAVDFLRSGALPYPALGRPIALGAWGMSVGATSVLLAAAQEPAIRAVVSDTSSAVAAPLLEAQVIAQGGLPALFVPGAFVAARVLYGIDYYAVRPVDVVARLAPRPVFFIHGENDSWLPASNLMRLAQAASAPPDAHVQTWIVPGVVEHAQTFHTAPAEYARRVVAFFAASLG